MTLKTDILEMLDTDISDALKLRLVKILAEHATDETPLADWELALLHDKSQPVRKHFRELQREMSRVADVESSNDNRRAIYRYVAKRIAETLDKSDLDKSHKPV
jgi:hypothetical protein